VAREQKCENCRFWEQWIDNLPDEPTPQPVYGFCRRYPPTSGEERVEMYGGGRFLAGESISTRPGQWCGEWQVANPETVDEVAAVMARQVIAGVATAGTRAELLDQMRGGGDFHIKEVRADGRREGEGAPEQGP
jgi:hypothetical protein